MAVIWNVVFIYGFAFIGLITSFYEFSPKIAVSAYQTLDSDDAFSAPFIVSNDGYLSIRLASVSCRLNDVLFKGISFGSGSGNFYVTADIDVADSLAPSEKWTVKCRFPHVYTDKGPLSKTLESADIQISISYQPYGLPLKLNREFRFQTMKTADGAWHWLPYPISNSPASPQPKNSK